MYEILTAFSSLCSSIVIIFKKISLLSVVVDVASVAASVVVY